MSFIPVSPIPSRITDKNSTVSKRFYLCPTLFSATPSFVCSELRRWLDIVKLYRTIGIENTCSQELVVLHYTERVEIYHGHECQTVATNSVIDKFHAKESSKAHCNRISRVEGDLVEIPGVIKYLSLTMSRSEVASRLGKTSTREPQIDL